MDADRRVIPLTEDDQGEGVKDPLTLDDILDLQFNKTIQEAQRDMFKKMIGNQFDGKHKDQPKAEWAPPKTFNRHR